MKICPQCAEEVQNAARVCKHCSHRLDGKGSPTDVKRNSQAGCVALVLIVFGFGTISQCGSNTVEPAKPDKSAETTAADLARCRKVIEVYTAAGVIKRVSPPTSGTIEIIEIVVDDDSWLQISADVKKSIAIAPACVNDSGQDEGKTFVDVKGFRSGKTLAEGSPGQGTLRLL